VPVSLSVSNKTMDGCYDYILNMPAKLCNMTVEVLLLHLMMQVTLFSHGCEHSSVQAVARQGNGCS
jgi:hypothetical protein